MASATAGLALAAATAGWMYLDAKHFLSYDLSMIKAALLGARKTKGLEASGKWNIYYVLEEQALDPKQANRLFLIYEGREWTYRQFYDNVLRYGQWIKREFGVASDEVVAFSCMNRPNFLFLWFGLWSIGAKAAHLNHNLTGAPLLHGLKTSTARLFLVDDEVRERLTNEVMSHLSSDGFRTAGGSVQVAFFSDSLEQELANTKPVREPDLVRAGQLPTSLAMLIYTSGTTGNPKPAFISWLRIHGTTSFVLPWLQLTKEDRFYTSMPLYHSAGATLAAITSLTAGCTLCLGHKFGTRSFWPEVRASKATYIQYVGETCRYLLAAPPSPLDIQNNVRVAFGNGLRPDIWNKFKERFGIETICEFYAATEGTASAWNRSRNSLTLGAAGRSGKLARWFGGHTIAIVEHDLESGKPFRDPQTGLCRRIDFNKAGAPPGELLAKLPDSKEERDAAFPGYYKDEKATESKVMRDVFVRGDAYFATGDMVRISPEGFTYFHDRIGDTFRWKSENVSTNEVADVLASHPAVAEANVYGVALPNHDGRAGCVAIVLKAADGSEKEDSTDVDEKTLADLARHALSNLPRYAVPLFARFPVAMQRTGTNKQQKHHLRAQGVEHSKIAETGDRMFWLKDGRYQPYGEGDWQSLKAGHVKL